MEIRKRSQKSDSEYSEKDSLGSGLAEHSKGGLSDEDIRTERGGCNIDKIVGG